MLDLIMSWRLIRKSIDWLIWELESVILEGMVICSIEEVKIKNKSLNIMLMNLYSYGWEVECYCFMGIIRGRVLWIYKLY